MRNELRQDPFSKRWVIIAKGRGRRPHEIGKLGEEPKLPKGYICPLCPGQEKLNIETFRVGEGKPGKEDWEVRSVLNKSPYFEAFSEEKAGVMVGREIFRHSIPIGIAEVLVETPNHLKDLPFMSKEEIEKIILAYQMRYGALRKVWNEVSIFRNHGYLAGQSITHPHSQITGTKEKSPESKREELNAIEYYYKHDECIYCATIKAEILKKKRIVTETNEFIVICPWASSKPYEIIIFPRRHQSNFEKASLAEIRELADVLQEILRRMYLGFSDPPYNYYIRSFSSEGPLVNSGHWYLKIIFHLSIPGGYEAYSTAFINAVPPEEAVFYLRKIKTSKINWQKEYQKLLRAKNAK